MIQVRRSITTEIADDLAELVLLSWPSAGAARYQAASEASSPTTSRRGSLASIFSSRPSVEVADVSALAMDLKEPRRGSFSKQIAKAVSFVKAK